MAWLEQTLSNIDRKRTPWIIVTGHRPIYSSAFGYSNSHGIPDGQSVPIQNAFEDLLVKYHVDIMLVGHVHVSVSLSLEIYFHTLTFDSPMKEHIQSTRHK